MTRERLVIVGAGLCGSILAARLRTRFEVTVVEPGLTPHPLLDEIACTTGGINSTINRASGLGGTTNYWHNALIELESDELLGCGIDPSRFAPFYARAWRLFLDEQQLALAAATHQANLQAIGHLSGAVAHMVVPQARANLWSLAQKAFPGEAVQVLQARAVRFHHDGGAGTPTLEVKTSDGVTQRITADRYLVCAGGLGTPVLLGRSLGWQGRTIGGYHDHPMTYVAKIRLKPDSVLKSVSCRDRASLSIRSGFVHEHDGIKAGFYLRPAISMGLRSITGDARYILSDLRNDPFSPRKILQLLTNPEAIREGLLFKSRAGFRGDYYSILLLGEQRALPDRGTRLDGNGAASLDWHVSPEEQAAYHAGLEAFLADHRDELVAVNQVPDSDWAYRTAAHHSGGAARFQAPDNIHEVPALPGVAVCDGSILRRGGIANSGLTLTALALRLADQLDPPTSLEIVAP